MSRLDSNQIDPEELARSHYENFPVGSFLIHPSIRPHVHRIYAFARVADDLADEVQDLGALRDWRAAFRDALDGQSGVPQLLADLTRTVREFQLPEELFFDLLDAFERDLTQFRYADLDDLISYCRQSADPIGRLLLHLHGKVDDENLRLSDRICTALQIVNHCQDVQSDYHERDRIYLPLDLLARHGVSEEDFELPECTRGLRASIAELVDFCGQGFAIGWPLARRLGGRFGLEVKAIVHSACLVLERLRLVDYEVFRRRPTVGSTDAPDVILRSLLLPWPPRAARAGP